MIARIACKLAQLHRELRGITRSFERMAAHLAAIAPITGSRRTKVIALTHSRLERLLLLLMLAQVGRPNVELILLRDLEVRLQTLGNDEYSIIVTARNFVNQHERLACHRHRNRLVIV